MADKTDATEKVRIGVIGCGVMGRCHIEAAKASPLMEVMAAADVKKEAVEAVGRDFGVPGIYTNPDDLIADPRVEAVILALPTAFRSGLALKAISVGKHALIEKPVAMNAAEVKQMIEAGKGLTAGCCTSRYRFMPSAEALTGFVSGGALGRIQLIRCRNIQPAGERPKKIPPAWRLRKDLNGGGILVNWGCYDLDYLLGITGWRLKPRTALAQTWPLLPRLTSHAAPGSDADAHYTATITFENGVTMVMERGEYLAAQPEETFEIMGENGSVRWKRTPEKNKEVIFQKADPDKGVIQETIWRGDEEWDTIMPSLLTDFGRAVLEGRQPKTGLQESLVVQKITDAIYASVEKNQTVQIN